VRAATLAHPPPSPTNLPDRFNEIAGAFVTLHVGEALRGCIGSVLPDVPLGVLVSRLGARAATRDPRFMPVRASELADLQVEVSVLSRTRAVTVDEIAPHRHGVYLRSGDASAVLLPQVASREGWNRKQLLQALCEKAGLPAGAEQDPAALLLVFSVTTIDGKLE
jgi:AmmeMemoRadiSam system protein A